MENEDWARLYRTFAGLGLPAPEIPCRVQLKPGKPAVELPIGWPDLKVGIGFDASPVVEFEKKDWTIVRMTSTTSSALPAALRFVDEVAFAHALRDAERSAELSTSKTETQLLEQLMRANLPVPDRNFRIVDEQGNHLTTPDFVWANLHLSVFVDGHYWHGYGQIQDLAAQMTDGARKSVVQERFKSKAAKDADVRRWMTARGWTVIGISDKTVDDGPDAVADAVREVVSTYHRLAAA